jgi:hypothetical protein
MTHAKPYKKAKKSLSVVLDFGCGIEAGGWRGTYLNSGVWFPVDFPCPLRARHLPAPRRILTAR